jgi:hypothetical protein
MKTSLKSMMQNLRSLGPYLLAELVLPGGTLIAALLWLHQHAAKRQNISARPQPVPRSVTAFRLASSRLRVSRGAQTAVALGRLAFQQELHHFRHDSGGPLIELRSRQVRDGMRHREEPKIRKAPGASHRAAGYLEHVRDDRSRGNAVLFENYAVEHTARAA